MLALCGLLSCAQSHAQLAWDTTQVEMNPAPGQTNISATFHFQNVGQRAVTLFGLKDGCGCSTSNLTRRSYAPGEKGDFTLAFAADGKPGHVVKHATLQTDDPYRPNVYLALVASVQEILTARPTSVQWRVGDPTTERIVELTLSDAPGIAIDSISSSDPQLLSLRCEGEGRTRRLIIAPKRTDRPARATIQIDTRFARGMHHPYRVHAAIVP